LETKTENYYRERLQNPGEWSLLVAKDGERIVGAFEASMAESQDKVPFGFIHWVCVDPEYQGKGVGPSLYQGYETLLRTRNVQYMVATIHDSNIPSLRMHERLGFNMTNPFTTRTQGGNRQSYFRKI
jgi:L-amino acid N-acyltransferase